ncbi:MAG: sporulation protein [Flavobacteriaceae bacterium]|nr:sporulation protein [Flavobacteriaceae bacterium]|tara:strand:+ start:63 stop:452 length:390 start_codon:yes stop_codon:yes gene_type:complete
MFFFKASANFFLLLLIFNCSTIFGQSKNLDIEISGEVERLLSFKILVNKKKYENDYYAIQLYNGNYEKAKKILFDFKKKFPEWESNLSFETPNYKVRVGNFKEYLKANKKLDFIRKVYPSAFLLRPNNL